MEHLSSSKGIYFKAESININQNSKDKNKTELEMKREFMFIYYFGPGERNLVSKVLDMRPTTELQSQSS